MLQKCWRDADKDIVIRSCSFADLVDLKPYQKIDSNRINSAVASIATFFKCLSVISVCIRDTRSGLKYLARSMYTARPRHKFRVSIAFK